MKNLTRKNQQLLLQARKMFVDENQYDEYELIGYCRLVKVTSKKMKEIPEGSICISKIYNVLKTLDKRRYNILRWRYWDGHARIIIARWLGISEERIRQLESKGISLVKMVLSYNVEGTVGIEVLNLEPTTYFALKRAGINTIDQLVEVTPNQLLAINRIGKNAFENIKQKLVDYFKEVDVTETRLECGKPIDVLKLNIRFENALKKAGIMSTEQLFSMPEEELCKIRGVGVSGINEIIKNKPKEFSKSVERKIETLGFGARTENALKKAGIRSVEQLLLLSVEEIKMIRGIGKKCCDEILDKIQELLCK